MRTQERERERERERGGGGGVREGQATEEKNNHM